MAPLPFPAPPSVYTAVFDLDDTLLAGDSDRAWGQFLEARGMLVAGLADDAYEAYVAGTIDFDRYTRQVLSPLQGRRRADVEQLLDEYLREYALDLITQSGRDLVEHHRAEGHRLVIATATNDLLAGPIAARYDVDHLVATRAQWRGDVLTGDFEGETAFQAGKLNHLLRWTDRSDLQRCYFYSDSYNDLPLLEAVSHPFAVNPDDRLRRHAQERGWPIMEMR